MVAGTQKHSRQILHEKRSDTHYVCVCVKDVEG